MCHITDKLSCTFMFMNTYERQDRKSEIIRSYIVRLNIMIIILCILNTLNGFEWVS